MWCAKCQSEVAVEARPSSQRLHCATCGTEITPRLKPPPPKPAGSPSLGGNTNPGPDQTTSGSKNTPQPTTPQDLLARWAGSQMFDPYGPIVTPGAKPVASKSGPSEPSADRAPPADSTPASSQVTPQATDSTNAPLLQDSRPATPPSSPAPSQASSQVLDKSARVRVDPAFTEGWNEVPTPHVTPPPNRRVGAPPVRMTEREVPQGHRAHASHGLRGPHFDPVKMKQQPVKSFRVAAEFGKYLAYLGALTLTVGAGMVLWGYLGGPTHYAPTGWFTTVVGQMLLFLGVVTLVSAGMEQTTAEVTRRIDTISEQMDRLVESNQLHSAAADAEIESELRAEIAELRKQLSQRE